MSVTVLKLKLLCEDATVRKSASFGDAWLPSLERAWETIVIDDTALVDVELQRQVVDQLMPKIRADVGTSVTDVQLELRHEWAPAPLGSSTAVFSINAVDSSGSSSWKKSEGTASGDVLLWVSKVQRDVVRIES